MKKLLSFSLFFLFIFNISLAYNPTAKDEKALDNVLVCRDNALHCLYG